MPTRWKRRWPRRRRPCREGSGRCTTSFTNFSRTGPGRLRQLPLRVLRGIDRARCRALPRRPHGSAGPAEDRANSTRQAFARSPSAPRSAGGHPDARLRAVAAPQRPGAKTRSIKPASNANASNSRKGQQSASRRRNARCRCQNLVGERFAAGRFLIRTIVTTVGVTITRRRDFAACREPCRGFVSIP